MHSILREYLQGAVGWLTVVTAFIAAVTALLRAVFPLLKETKIIKKIIEKIIKQRTPRPPPPSPGVKLKSLIIGVVLLFVATVAFDYVTKPPLISVSEERTNAAWDYFKKGEPNPIRKHSAVPENLNRAVEIADTVVADLTGPANAKQRSLSSEGVPNIATQLPKSLMANFDPATVNLGMRNLSTFLSARCQSQEFTLLGAKGCLLTFNDVNSAAILYDIQALATFVENGNRIEAEWRFSFDSLGRYLRHCGVDRIARPSMFLVNLYRSLSRINMEFSDGFEKALQKKHEVACHALSNAYPEEFRRFCPSLYVSDPPDFGISTLRKPIIAAQQEK